MPPRKTSAAASTEPPRRSSRIVSQPKEEPKPTKPKASKKRPVAADTEDAAAPEDGSSAAKKAKSGNAKSDAEGEAEEEDQLEDADTATLGPIDVGDVLPSVMLKNEKGEDVDVAGLAAEKGLVVFLVPKADTPGCTTQACGFRDSYPDFTSVGYDVYCLSADSPTAQTKWQTKKELPYPLLSDPKRVLITALGAGEGGKTKRSHFIFEKGGKLLDKKVPVKPADSPKLALEFIKSL
ncbi:AhpC-TSA-domain-containing protein [Lyophyllum atratum]|nr:AhpC-TSA-domain-containing protein [Lyophyllum atratum]